MEVLKKVFNFYINTSIHVAVAVFSLVQITKLSLNISTSLSVDYFIFFGTILGYNFLKYFEVFWNRNFTFQKNYSIILVSLMALLGMVFYFFKLEVSVQWAFFEIGFVVLIYPFLRKYGFLKMFVVSFCVTYITVYIPLLYYEFKYIEIFIFLFLRFLIIICFLIPLEIVDMKSDSKTIYTLPQKIGIQNTKYLGYSLLVLSLILHLVALNFAIDIVIVIEFFVAIITAVFIFFSTENRSKYYSSFWVESIPILWFFLLFVFEDLFKYFDYL